MNSHSINSHSINSNSNNIISIHIIIIIINLNINSSINLQPNVSLFTMFWARAAPKHRYLHAFGRPGLPNTIIYATFALSYRCGCKCRRDPPPAKSIAIYTVLGQGCSKTCYLHSFGRPVLPNTIIYLRKICLLMLVWL